VLIDSSFLYSALVYDGKPLGILMMIIEENILVLSDYIIEEVKRNIQNKLDPLLSKRILMELSIFVNGCEIKRSSEYEHLITEAKQMISRKDSPILACGMLSDIDFLISSDKEFWKIKHEKVRIVTPGELQFLIT
jgi:hypothetical protein